ncbi:phosphopantetheine-binding protein [Kitasatospora sp. NPDC056184]|uniref:phosphopantetheine-binding protein n=1 Tax=Kitasatospora sp. NPDC056184 TaxID=3345738 RepID=UPI0035E0DD8F
MNTARRLVGASLDSATFLNRLADDDDFATAGVNSGELIKLALGCEDFLGRALDDEELANLTSISAVDELIAASRRVG